jgi:serine/threonine protein kinase, bacterial
MTVGTVAYSALEQLMGEDVDGRADQYALAATTLSPTDWLAAIPSLQPRSRRQPHLNSVPPALADTRPELAALDAILAAALAKNPNDRFARCSDFACALAEQSPTHSPPAAAAPTARAPPAVRSHRADAKKKDTRSQHRSTEPSVYDASGSRVQPPRQCWS